MSFSSDSESVTDSAEIAMAMATSSRYAMAVPVSEPEVENSVNGSSRSARSRRSRRRHLRRPTVASSVYAQPPRQRLPLLPPTPPSRGPNVPRVITFLFEKQLQKSDVNAAGRIVIPKRVAELHLPPLDAKEGMWMHFDDIDYITVWTFKFRFWPNNSSRMYIFENTKSFTEVFGLKMGDFIMVFIDDRTKTYLVRARRNPDDLFFHEEMARPNIALNGRISAPPVIQPPESNSLYYEEEGSSSMVAFGGLDEELQFSRLVRSTSFESIDFSDFFG